MDAKPSQALRKGRWKSSMWLAIQSVRDGGATAVVSAGNTGALMVMAKFCLKAMKGVERPAIAAIWPTIDAECIVLDVGANVGATSRQIVEFALMGAGMARALFGMAKPSVGLLNIGVEEIKGVEEIRDAAAVLKEAPLPLRYHGFVEGDDIGRGTVDVVVTDGFTGNIALKTAEGTAKQIGAYLRAAMGRSLLARLGAVLAQGALRALKDKMDPRHMNGGIFLGLNGIVVKSHGGTDATGFASAIDLAYEMASSRVVEQLGNDVAHFHTKLELEGAA
jgi:glycerol-3-phosphate acyltransferase PlsX